MISGALPVCQSALAALLISITPLQTPAAYGPMPQPDFETQIAELPPEVRATLENVAYRTWRRAGELYMKQLKERGPSKVDAPLDYEIMLNFFHDEIDKALAEASEAYSERAQEIRSLDEVSYWDFVKQNGWPLLAAAGIAVAVLALRFVWLVRSGTSVRDAFEKGGYFVSSIYSLYPTLAIVGSMTLLLPMYTGYLGQRTRLGDLDTMESYEAAIEDLRVRVILSGRQAQEELLRVLSEVKETSPR